MRSVSCHGAVAESSAIFDNFWWSYLIFFFRMYFLHQFWWPLCKKISPNTHFLAENDHFSRVTPFGLVLAERQCYSAGPSFAKNPKHIKEVVWRFSDVFTLTLIDSFSVFWWAKMLLSTIFENLKQKSIQKPLSAVFSICQKIELKILCWTVY